MGVAKRANAALFDSGASHAADDHLRHQIGFKVLSVRLAENEVEVVSRRRTSAATIPDFGNWQDRDLLFFGRFIRSPAFVVPTIC